MKLNIDLIVAAVVGFILIGYIGPTSIQSMVNASGISNGSVATATGYLTYSGNVTNGELVNITDPSIGAIYTFEFNTTAGSTIACRATNCIPVNLTGPTAQYRTFNDSWTASGNLTAAINANASTADLVTAVNTTNRTTLTAKVSGATANAIGLSTTAANITISNMAGGRDASTTSAAIYAIFTTVMPVVATVVYLLIIVFLLKKGVVK